MERTAGNHGLAAAGSNVNVSGFKRPACNRQRFAGIIITKNQCLHVPALCGKGAALDGDSSAIDPQWRPAGSSLDFSVCAGILDGQGRTGFAQLQPSRQRAAVQIQRVIAGNIEFFTRIRCFAIRQQPQRAAVLLHCGKGVRNVGVVHIPHLCHGVLRRDFRRLGRRLRLNRRLFVCGGRTALRRVRFRRPCGGDGQERQAQGQRHEHTQYSLFHAVPP